MPEATLINVNCPAGEPSGIEVTRLGKRIYNDELKLVGEDDDRRRRYEIYGWKPGYEEIDGTDLYAVARGGSRSPRSIRPHRPRRPRDTSASGASRRCSRPAGRRREPGAESGRRARRGAPQGAHAPQRALLPPGRTGDRRRRLRRADRRAARDRGRAPRSAQRRFAHPAGRRGAVEPLPRGRAPRAMLSLGNARSEEELRAWETGSTTTSSASTSPPPNSATRPSRRSTGWRSRSPTRTGSSPAARPAATARSARTSRRTCRRSRRSRRGSRMRRP